MIINYKLVADSNYLSLEKKVLAMMNKGWEIYGSIITLPDEVRNRGYIVVQTMVKKTVKD